MKDTMTHLIRHGMRRLDVEVHLDLFVVFQTFLCFAVFGSHVLSNFGWPDVLNITGWSLAGLRTARGFLAFPLDTIAIVIKNALDKIPEELQFSRLSFQSFKNGSVCRVAEILDSSLLFKGDSCGPGNSTP